MKASLAGLMVLAATSPLSAQDKKDLCSERPGLTTNECVIDRGHVQLETSIADWSLDKRSDERKDTILFGDTLARIGVGHGLELRLGWTPFGYERDRDDDGVTHDHRTGDITIGLKQNLVDAQKHGDVGPSLAVIPFAVLPAGRMPIGATTWAAGAQVPFGYRFSRSVKIEYTTIVQAAPDEEERGRHLRYSGALGVKYNPSDPFSLQIEEQVERDRDPDPEQRGTLAKAGLSAAYQPNRRLQVDLGTNVGENGKTPDVEVYAGITRLF